MSKKHARHLHNIIITALTWYGLQHITNTDGKITINQLLGPHIKQVDSGYDTDSQRPHRLVYIDRGHDLQNCPCPWGTQAPRNTWFSRPTQVYVPNGSSLV